MRYRVKEKATLEGSKFIIEVAQEVEVFSHRKCVFINVYKKETFWSRANVLGLPMGSPLGLGMLATPCSSFANLLEAELAIKQLEKSDIIHIQ